VGDGTMTPRLVPTLVSGLPADVTQVQASGYSTCARRSGGMVSCWGAGVALGDGVGDNRAVPGPVLGLGSAIAVRGASVASHFCAEMADHTVKCWGNNAYGQIGDGTYNFATKPVDVKF